MLEGCKALNSGWALREYKGPLLGDTDLPITNKDPPVFRGHFLKQGLGARIPDWEVGKRGVISGFPLPTHSQRAEPLQRQIVTPPPTLDSALLPWVIQQGGPSNFTQTVPTDWTSRWLAYSTPY